MIITEKKQMYRLLKEGRLGNTIPQYFDLDSWDSSLVDLWGVRSNVAGGDKRMRLNVPVDQVKSYVEKNFKPGEFNLSPMIDKYAVLKANLVDTDKEPFVRSLHYCINKLILPWRQNFKHCGFHSNSRYQIDAILKHHCWPSSYDMLRELLEEFPYHVIEFTITDRAVGLMPQHNVIIWEIRYY